jgi:hypothetical protein
LTDKPKHWLVSLSLPHGDDALDTKERVTDFIAAQLGSSIRETITVIGPVEPAKKDASD